MGITGAAINDGLTGILNSWADLGLFSYGLPFLLIFAVVYGILSKTNILGEQNKNKGVNSVIAIAVALLALQWDIVPNFFATIFPYAGVGLAVLLVILILMGLFGGGKFVDDHNKLTAMGWIFFTIGVVIALMVIIPSLTDFSFAGGAWWSEYGSGLVAILIVGLLVWLTVGSKSDDNPGGQQQGRV
jgi:hypothetical protein